MNDLTSNRFGHNKRIAINTIVLYARMVVIIFVSLFTVRIILKGLGVEDYGIYNVVGGFVSMFSFLSATMASATQRYFAFELGKNDSLRLKRIFSLSFIIYIVIALIILLAAETIGLWFLNNRMTIPTERLYATNWVYQLSILSFVVTILTLPYNSALIAHENMRTYAMISIFEILLKLVSAYLLFLVSNDKLIYYGIFLFATTTIVSVTTSLYSIKQYNECKFKFYWNKTIFSELISYAGWNMIGALANIFKNQGVNVLLNIFFGPLVNASRGISIQVNTALNSFVTNIYMAIRPHITKVYASGDKEYMISLVFKSSKFSFFLLLLISMPLVLETEYIIQIWLGKIPEHVVLFTRLLIVNILIEAMNNQLVAALQAVGRIKTYQIVISSLLILILPISYILYKYGATPETSLFVSISISIISFVPQIWIVKSIVGLSIRNYVKEVVTSMIVVSIISYIAPTIILYTLSPGFLRFIIVVSAGIISSLSAVYFIGCNGQERQLVTQFIKNKLDSFNVKI